MTSLLPAIPTEKLSLSTFEPSLAQPPYLTTPRSLEACRLNGVNPIELVEVSLDEFRKDFPNDPDAAQRRYERVEGARKRILQHVISDWKRLNEIGWKSKIERPHSAKETIIPVAAEAHCELLEIQAEKFRKIERDQMDALKRLLNMEIKHAVQESKNKQVLGKHEAIAEANDQQRRMRAQMREELHREHVERMKQKEEDEMREIKAAQKMEAEYSIMKQQQAIQNAKAEKKRRESLEFRRQQQLHAIKQKKDGILKDIELSIEQKKQMQAFRDSETKTRQDKFKYGKNAHKADRQKESEARLEKTRNDAYQAVEDRRSDMLHRMEAEEIRRKRMNDEREAERLRKQEEENNLLHSKIERAKQLSVGGAEEKSNKTKIELEYKEQLAKQELDKVRAAQEKRRAIKQLRQESYILAATRAKKMEDYKMSRLNQDIKNKDDRSNAIQEGYKTLSKMRNTMKDIMQRATLCLKDEIHHLHHKDDASPDKVMSRAVYVADSMLFPHLKQKFGIANKLSDSTLRMLAESDAGGRATTAPTTSQSLDSTIASAAGNNRPGTQHAKGVGHSSSSRSRSTKGSLPLHVLTKDTLLGTLKDAKTRMAEEEEREEIIKNTPKVSLIKRRPKKGNISRSRSSSPNATAIPASVPEVSTPAASLPSPAVTERVAKTPKTGGGMNTAHGGSYIPGGDYDLFPQYNYSVSAQGDDYDDDRDLNLISKKAIYTREPGANEFRREFSSDHPLAPGGKGSYDKEKKTGKKGINNSFGASEAEMLKNKTEQKIEKLIYESQAKVVDPKRQLEIMKKEQNEALLRVLEDERFAEETREKMLRTVTDDEKRKLELIFAEERRRASERIISMTKEHEARIRDAVITMMSLGKAKKSKAHSH